MANVSLNKKIEEQLKDALCVTDGQITGYTGSRGFVQFPWPGTLTVDLGSCYSLFCIRFLLWDNLGEGGGQRVSRLYKYRLVTSTDHNIWKVIFDTEDKGYNGWQVFIFPEEIKSRYIRIHGLWNSANPNFHMVQLEAHDSEPPQLNAEVTLKRNINQPISEEISDGFSISTRIIGITNNIDQLVESTSLLNPTPFKELISQLRIQVSDVTDIERSMDSIRREIIQPVKNELEQSRRLGKYSLYGFLIGLIGGIMAIISLMLSFF